MARIRVKDRGSVVGFLEGTDAESLAEVSAALAQQHLPGGWDWVVSSRSARVAMGRDGAGRSVYWKAFLDRDWTERPKAWLRGSRAKRAWQQSEELHAQGFNAPTVLCWGRVHGLDVMVTAAVPGIGCGTLMRQYLERRGEGARVLRTKRLLLARMGALVGRLHRAGIVHGDLRPNNVLADFTGDDVVFNLIDNERNRRYAQVPMAKVHKNLVQITLLPPEELSITDRARILGPYFRTYGRFSRSEAGQLIGAVYRRVMERL